VSRDFDVIVVGSGPGGSTAADVLTQAGRSVVIFERGRNHLINLENPNELLYEFSNDELKFSSRHFLGPDPWLEPRTFRLRETDGDRLYVGEVNNLPATVGGGGVHADGKLPRFREDDFRVLSELGPVDGASVADWPLGYDELEPYYAEAERAVGVAGDAQANPFAPWRSGPYPMPPGAPMYCALVTSAAAERLGYHPYPAPTGCNSIPYDGRPACNNCGFCAFYGCPIHAKGDPVGLLRRALTSGRAELRPNSFVKRVVVANGRATGVEWIDSDGETHVEKAEYVIVAAGAMETPRLLLLSGIEHPLIGRNLMFHFQTLTFGQLPMRIHGHKGRDVTHAHDDFILVDAAARAAAAEAGLPWLKGGLVEHGAASHPVVESKLYPWGAAHKEMMRESPMRDHLVGFTMQGEDLPQATNRIDLDPEIRDVHGLPVARTTYHPHRHELVASAYYAPKLEAILAEAGAVWSVSTSSPRLGGVSMAGLPRLDTTILESVWEMGSIPTSRHIAGTVRMGTDPTTSVCDEWGRLHDVPNVVICDSSTFPTAAGYGPTLTLVALSIRNSRALTT
jgi:choline dehydrogenase-like flavoprotein